MRLRPLLLLALLAACRPGRRDPATPPLPEARSGEVRSNIERADYVGSAACARCHRNLTEPFERSPMHRMTRAISTTEVRAPFSGEFHFKRDAVRLFEERGERFMEIRAASETTRRFRVTKVIGGHHREDYAGVEVSADEPLHATDAAHPERILPLSFSYAANQWRYKGYSVMTPERPGLRPGAVWRKTCIFCHNTEPYLDAILGALAASQAEPYQGEVVDALLPPARRWAFDVTDDAALRRAVVREVAAQGGRAQENDPSLLLHALRSTRSRFDERHLVELGIGCESCHGGCREHVEDVSLRPVLEPRSPFLRVRHEPLAPAAERAQRINRTCARCHQVLFSRYPWTWEGGTRAEKPGGSNINSGEARDLLLGGCASAMSCVDCHNPHSADNQHQMAALDEAAGDAVCLRCHGKFAGAEVVRAHTHHDPNGQGARCMNCHMPRKNMSLDNRLTRYHRIGSPTDAGRVLGDRPLECALCHGDRRVEELVSTMERWWNKSFDRAQLIQLYGSLDARPLEATVQRGKPHEQATAVAALGELRIRTATPLVATQLVADRPIVRYFAERALSELVGRAPAIDLFQDNDAISAQVEQFLRSAGIAAQLPHASGHGEAGED